MKNRLELSDLVRFFRKHEYAITAKWKTHVMTSIVILFAVWIAGKKLVLWKRLLLN